MQQRVLILLLVAFIAGAGWWFLHDKSGAPQDHEDSPAAAVSPGNEQLDNNSPAPGSDDSNEIDTARQRIADATLALQAAIAQRKAAEADLQTAEQEVEALERWIAEIEARGEDPVDYADEGLAKLQPAFYAYEDAFDRLELAEAMEAAASSELAAAKATLPGARALNSDDQ